MVIYCVACTRSVGRHIGITFAVLRRRSSRRRRMSHFFLVIVFSAAINPKPLIFGMKLQWMVPYRGIHFQVCRTSTSCLPT